MGASEADTRAPHSAAELLEGGSDTMLAGRGAAPGQAQAMKLSHSSPVLATEVPASVTTAAQLGSALSVLSPLKLPLPMEQGPAPTKPLPLQDCTNKMPSPKARAAACPVPAPLARQGAKAGRAVDQHSALASLKELCDAGELHPHTPRFSTPRQCA